MNKIILLLLITSSIAMGGEGEGTAGTPSSSTTSNETVYQLVCAPVVDQESSQNCIVVEVPAES